MIGCRILTQPFFLDEAEWVRVPASWARQIVQGKTYSVSDADGAALWDAVSTKLQSRAQVTEVERFGAPVLVRPGWGKMPSDCWSLTPTSGGARSRVSEPFPRWMRHTFALMPKVGCMRLRTAFCSGGTFIASLIAATSQ